MRETILTPDERLAAALRFHGTRTDLLLGWMSRVALGKWENKPERAWRVVLCGAIDDYARRLSYRRYLKRSRRRPE